MRALALIPVTAAVLGTAASVSAATVCPPATPPVAVGVLTIAATPPGDGYQPADGRPMLGVGVGVPSLPTQERERLPVGVGAQVNEVYPGTAADRMGIRPGDVVVAVNGQEVHSFEDMRQEIVHGSRIGEQVEVTISRDGARIALQDRLGRWPDDMPYREQDDAFWRAQQEAQRQRVAHDRQRIDRLASDLAELRSGAAAPARPWHASHAIDALLAWLDTMPAWRLSLHRQVQPTSDGAPDPEASDAAPVGPRSAEASWHLRFSADSSGG